MNAVVALISYELNGHSKTEEFTDWDACNKFYDEIIEQGGTVNYVKDVTGGDL